MAGVVYAFMSDIRKTVSVYSTMGWWLQWLSTGLVTSRIIVVLVRQVEIDSRTMLQLILKLCVTFGSEGRNMPTDSVFRLFSVISARTRGVASVLATKDKLGFCVD